MDRRGTWPPLFPLDWIELILRWVFLVALPLVAGMQRIVFLELGIVLIAWAAFSFFLRLATTRGWRPPWPGWVAGVIDIAFALAAIEWSGGLSSPLWWGLLLGPLTVALRENTRLALIHRAAAGVAAALVRTLIAGEPAWTLLPVAGLTLLLVLAMYGLSPLVRRLRAAAKEMARWQRLTLEGVRDQERERSRTVFRLAAELNATLNYERVLDLALDLSARALSNHKPEDTQLVSALLLFEDDALCVASARGLPTTDRRAQLPGQSGVVGRAITTGEPRISHDPARDPELQRLVALHNCQVAVCIPLLAGLEAYGVLLFAHPSGDYFTAERVELMQAVGNQVITAIQNARLYRDLEVEKERMSEIQEEARKKLARDLHDGPTQSIAAIAMRTNFARRLMERDPKSAADELFKVEDLARRTTKEIRHMLFTLRPLILESQGLVAALHQLAEKMWDTHGQTVTVEAETDVATDLEMGRQGVIFYIAEEAVNNARKHAEAERTWVRLWRNADLFFLEIEDDGVGFNVGAVDANYEQRGSLGMVNMRERAELVNGVLRVTSTEGRGTRIRVVVPLSEESADRLHRAGYVA